MDTTRAGHRDRSVGSHLPLRHAVLEEIRRRIVAGEWAPGQRILEDQLAAELDVSRNPIREALQALARRGLRRARTATRRSRRDHLSDTRRRAVRGA